MQYKHKFFNSENTATKTLEQSDAVTPNPRHMMYTKYLKKKKSSIRMMK